MCSTDARTVFPSSDVGVIVPWGALEKVRTTRFSCIFAPVSEVSHPSEVYAVKRQERCDSSNDCTTAPSHTPYYGTCKQSRVRENTSFSEEKVHVCVDTKYFFLTTKTTPQHQYSSTTKLTHTMTNANKNRIPSPHEEPDNSSGALAKTYTPCTRLPLAQVHPELLHLGGYLVIPVFLQDHLCLLAQPVLGEEVAPVVFPVVDLQGLAAPGVPASALQYNREGGELNIVQWAFSHIIRLGRESKSLAGLSLSRKTNRREMVTRGRGWI